ncbi:hypothetical protein TNCV_1894441 [Trichonephila clavipes]|nr:hypothetical protein TNCV_1894441 [Trichonephila clavipes]
MSSELLDATPPINSNTQTLAITKYSDILINQTIEQHESYWTLSNFELGSRGRNLNLYPALQTTTLHQRKDFEPRHIQRTSALLQEWSSVVIKLELMIRRPQARDYDHQATLSK